MVKLDLYFLLYLESQDFRILTAVETGMRNHEIVPGKMVAALAELRSGTGKILKNLCFNKLLKYERGKKYDGYRLTNLGYDYLALRVLKNRGYLNQLGTQIGIGKEASVYLAGNSETGDQYVLKVHRLGRTSFKTVFNKRDYHKNKIGNWLYLSRLSALREFSFLKALYDKNFNVPKPIDNNRHCILMEFIDGILLNNIISQEEINAKKLLNDLLDMILDLANKYGLVHGDFNEFNILIENETFRPILIDFPQMISTDHKLAKTYFERDVNCIVNFFEKRFNCFIDEIPTFDNIDIENEPQEVVKIDDSKHEMLFRFLNEESYDYSKSEEENDLNDISNDYLKKINKDFHELCLENKLDEQSNKEIKHDENNEIERNINCLESENSKYSYLHSKLENSSIVSSFTYDEIKNRLRKEKARKDKKELLKHSLKNIKSDSNAVFRKRKENLMNIKEDGTIWDLF